MLYGKQLQPLKSLAVDKYCSKCEPEESCNGHPHDNRVKDTGLKAGTCDPSEVRTRAEAISFLKVESHRRTVDDGP